MNQKKNILILGYPATGKTVFLCQFYGRIKDGKGKIRFSGKPEHIKPIVEARDKLSEGKEPEATNAKDYQSLCLPLTINNENFELICPDYGGEQVLNIVENRVLNNNWKTNLERSNHWLLLIRPSFQKLSFNLLNKQENISKIKEYAKNPLSKKEITEQTQFIELLQIMIDAKGKGVKKSISDIKLVIALTCWDELELPPNTTPSEFMKEKFPLLYNFVENIWDNTSLKFLGLSSQEFSLKIPENQEKYLDELPESFGYVVLENGKHDKDLTLLVENVL